MEIINNPKLDDDSRVNLFLATHGSKFLPHQLEEVKNIISGLSESQFQYVLSQEYRDPTSMLLISLIGGPLGIDRFVLNDTVLGVIKLITCGGFMVWTIIDWFLIQDMTKEYNFQLLTKAIAFSR